MPTLGVAVAILDTKRILLIKREDFEVWALPGGGVDAGESLAQAAVREAREETGLRVSLTRLVGVYSRPHWNHGGDHVVLFAAVPRDGVLLQDADAEVLDARYFGRHELPDELVPWHRQRICDALDSVGGGVAWSQTTIWPFAQGMTREEIYHLRDRSGLSRQQFYAQYLAPTLTEEHRIRQALHWKQLSLLRGAEYLVFDPTARLLGTPCRGWRRVGEASQEWRPESDGRYHSRLLRISFRPEGDLLRVIAPDGSPMPYDHEKDQTIALQAQENAALRQEIADLRAELERLRTQRTDEQG